MAARERERVCFRVGEPSLCCTLYYREHEPRKGTNQKPPLNTPVQALATIIRIQSQTTREGLPEKVSSIHTIAKQHSQTIHTPNYPARSEGLLDSAKKGAKRGNPIPQGSTRIVGLPFTHTHTHTGSNPTHTRSETKKRFAV